MELGGGTLNGLPRFLGTLMGKLVPEAVSCLFPGLGPTAAAELTDRLGSEPAVSLGKDSAEFVFCTERRRRWFEPYANFTKIYGHCFKKTVQLFTTRSNKLQL